MIPHNAMAVMKKDLAEFRRQKLVIGSIIAMPLILGILIPISLFAPIAMEAPDGPTWDVENLFSTGTLGPGWAMPSTSSVLEGIETADVTLSNTRIDDATIERAVLTDCIVHDTELRNATLHSCALDNVDLYNCVVTNSKGAALDGNTIMSIDSELTFEKTRESDLEQLLPTFLNMTLILFIILPVTLPTIIASYSIVGEKNNKSLEPILASPTTDGELLLGKVLSAFVPSMASTLGAVVVGGALVNVFLAQLGEPLLPNLTWILGILLLAPLACLMSILACVIVSSRVTDVRAAQQVGGFIVMPVIVLMFGVLAGVILLTPLAMLAICAAFAAANGGLYYFAKAIFNREDILIRWA